MRPRAGRRHRLRAPGQPDHGQRRRLLRRRRRHGRGGRRWVEELSPRDLHAGRRRRLRQLPRRRGRRRASARPTRARPGTGWPRSRRTYDPANLFRQETVVELRFVDLALLHRIGEAPAAPRAEPEECHPAIDEHLPLVDPPLLLLVQLAAEALQLESTAELPRERGEQLPFRSAQSPSFPSTTSAPNNVPARPATPITSSPVLRRSPREARAARASSTDGASGDPSRIGCSAPSFSMYTAMARACTIGARSSATRDAHAGMLRNASALESWSDVIFAVASFNCRLRSRIRSFARLSESCVLMRASATPRSIGFIT